LLARRHPPPLDAVAAALDGFAAEMGALRREGLTRTLALEGVERIFALGFALDQLRSRPLCVRVRPDARRRCDRCRSFETVTAIKTYPVEMEWPQAAPLRFPARCLS
jgi:hypothetical protein